MTSQGSVADRDAFPKLGRVDTQKSLFAAILAILSLAILGSLDRKLRDDAIKEELGAMFDQKLQSHLRRSDDYSQSIMKDIQSQIKQSHDHSNGLMNDLHLQRNEKDMQAIKLALDKPKEEPLNECNVLLSTFANSGTTWTQAVFTSATGVVSEAVYKEGPPSLWPGTFVHGEMPSPNSGRRFANHSLGECRFIKSHQRLAGRGLVSKYQRAVVLYRDPLDNFEANIRYLKKETHPNHVACKGVDFDRWKDEDSADGFVFKKIHYLSHRRFYCQAQQYPVPRMFITYTRLLAKPFETFRDILTFIGYHDADLDKAMAEHPPANHTSRGSLNYVPISDENCSGLDQQYIAILQNISDCPRLAANWLQY
ncbi:hypothetical protein ACHAWF_005460 [Thalassiosira exigua]